MRNPVVTGVLASILLAAEVMAGDHRADPDRDILVTFSNEGASPVSTAIVSRIGSESDIRSATEARQHAAEIASDYALVEIDRWPIRSLSVFCFIYRVPPALDRQSASNASAWIRGLNRCNSCIVSGPSRIPPRDMTTRTSIISAGSMSWTFLRRTVTRVVKASESHCRHSGGHESRRPERACHQ